MRMQIIQAPSMKQAMVRIQKELGSDAVIIQTRKHIGGVEVVVGIQEKVNDEALLENTFNYDEHKMMIESRLDRIDQRMQDMMNKISSIRASKSTAESKENRTSRNECQQEYYQAIEKIGFSSEMSQVLFSGFIKKEKTANNANMKINSWISRLLDLAEGEMINEPGIHAMIGPTGSGKTTSIIKIANSYINKYGANNIGIITTDAESIYIKNKLDHFCDIFNVDFDCVSSPSELNVALLKMKDKPFVLIDTHGISHNNPTSIASIKNMLLSKKQKINVYMTLACNQQEASMQKIASHFSRTELAGCILTKLDDCEKAAPAIGVSMHHHLPIFYLFDGEDLDRNIHFPTRERIGNILTVSLPERRSSRLATFWRQFTHANFIGGLEALLSRA